MCSIYSVYIVVYLVVRWKGGQELKQGVCGRPTEWRERERDGEKGRTGERKIEHERGSGS